MQSSNFPNWMTYRIKISFLIIGLICAALGSCAYLFWRGQTVQNQFITIAPSQHQSSPTASPGFRSASHDLQPSIIHVEATTVSAVAPKSVGWMEVIHDDVVTLQKATKARQLYMELLSHKNFQLALENPQARANIERLLTHPEIEKKLNGWFASLIRSAIYKRVEDPEFPQLVAAPNYVDDLFKQYGIS